MAKRFTDSVKYKKKFFRELTGPYKLLWDFLYHDCDNCGIWIIDFEMAQKYVGKDMPIDQETALQLFNKDETRIVEIDGGEKWFLPGFIEFQYGHLSEKNRAHIPVIAALKKFGLLNPDLSLKEKINGDTGPLQRAKDKAQEKEMEKDKDIAPPENFAQETQFDTGSVIVEMAKIFYKKNPKYPKDQLLDFTAVQIIAGYILDEKNIPGNDYPKSREIILTRWGELTDFIRSNSHFVTYSLTQLRKHYQSVVQSFNNGNKNGKTGQGGINRPAITGTATTSGQY